MPVQCMQVGLKSKLRTKMESYEPSSSSCPLAAGFSSEGEVSLPVGSLLLSIFS